jgi:hypothetical protein
VANRIIRQPEIRVYIENRRAVEWNFDPENGGDMFIRNVG